MTAAAVQQARSFVAAYLSGPGNETPTAFATRLRPYVTAGFEQRLARSPRGFQNPDAHDADIVSTSVNDPRTVTVVTNRWTLNALTGAAADTPQSFTVTVTLAPQRSGQWRADQIELAPAT